MGAVPVRSKRRTRTVSYASRNPAVQDEEDGLDYYNLKNTLPQKWTSRRFTKKSIPKPGRSRQIGFEPK